MTVRHAILDPQLRAIVRSRTPLTYADGADETLDRPAHVRAASSLAWIHGLIAVVQDDANFVALVDPATAHVRVLALPGGEGGLRQFDDNRGNKKFKFDLEACVAIDTQHGPKLLAFGSGSTTERRKIIALDQFTLGGARIALSNARTLYEQLELATDFSGSEMNIEGVLNVGDVIRFFGRGNGASHGNLVAVNATCDISLEKLLPFLERPYSTPPQQPSNIVQYSLGNIDGVALGFTDATPYGHNVLYSAAAELSADATVDGPVAGSAIGVITPDGTVRYALLTDINGIPIKDKVEGLLMAKDSQSSAYVVVDADNPTQASELCSVELSGNWNS